MNKFYEKFYNFQINGIDDFFDLNYEEYPDTIEKILTPLYFLIIGIPLLMIYEIHFKVGNNIYPFSIGNYIHAQYQNIINEQNETENNLKYNRWNIPLCSEDK